MKKMLSAILLFVLSNVAHANKGGSDIGSSEMLAATQAINSTLDQMQTAVCNVKKIGRIELGDIVGPLHINLTNQVNSLDQIIIKDPSKSKEQAAVQATGVWLNSRNYILALYKNDAWNAGVPESFLESYCKASSLFRMK